MRLIDADELKRECEKLPRVLDDEFIPFVKVKDITKTINNAPTIEAEPGRHGKWNIRTFDLPREVYYCSECGTVEWRTSRFFPNCGAKMDEKE